jgi:hypothetical protein
MRPDIQTAPDPEIARSSRVILEIGVAVQLKDFSVFRMMRPVLVLAGMLFLISCGAEAPVFDFGSIEVTSTPPGAAIFLNGDDTGFSTPHTLTGLDLIAHKVWVNSDELITVQNEVTLDLQTTQNTSVDFTLSATGFRIDGPTGARILADGIDTGRTAPAGVSVHDPGSVFVSLELDGYLVSPDQIEVTIVEEEITEIPAGAFSARSKKTVVLEGFANVSCMPCPELTDNLLTMAAKPEFSHDRVQFIEFSVSWPELGDPFFQANPGENFARLSLYNVMGAPDLYVEGVRQADALNAADMESAVLAALDSEPGFLIDVTADFFESSVPVTVTLNPYQDINFEGYVLFVAIYRREIVFDPAPGLNGQTHFHHVFIDRVDNPPALPVVLPAGVQEQYTLPLSIRYPGEDIYVAIAFIQNEADLTILQAGSTEVTAAERKSR